MKKILHFEDDVFIAEIYDKKFKESGFDYKWYSEPPEKGDELIDLVLRENPDIIISDITHPKMDGFEMLRNLKTDKRTINIPFVFFTNHNSKEEKEKARAMGAYAYFITVETTPDMMVDALKKVERNDDLQKIDGGRRGVFVLVEKLSSGEDKYLSFSFNDAISAMIKKWDKNNFKETYKLAIFNEILFANWFLVEIIKDKLIPDSDKFFIFHILDQNKWDFVRNQLAKDGITSASLNPCIAKDHRCPTYQFFLDEEKDFNKMNEWFSKCPNKHYTLKGYEKNGLLLLYKPSFDENDNFKLLEE